MPTIKKPDHIRCVGSVIDIDSVAPDPMNARLHPEPNLAGIKESLLRFGQRHPLVVRKQNMMIATGNGRWRVAKEIGWSVIAADIQPMSDDDFRDFALADNRIPELADWDYAILQKLDEIAKASKSGKLIGWTDRELRAFRSRDWTPPKEGMGEKSKYVIPKGIIIKILGDSELGAVIEAIHFLMDHGLMNSKNITNEAAIAQICKEWLEAAQNAIL